MISKLPFKTEIISENDNYYVLMDEHKDKYILLKLDKKLYSIYLDLVNMTDNISKFIYEFIYDNNKYLLFDYNDYKTSDNVKVIKLLESYEKIFDKSSFEVTLKKQNIKNLNKMYQILDHKYTYFEFRIREVETSPYKNDLSWIILSKYNVILDTKLYLYDLQQDIFKFIDKEEVVKYGIIPKSMFIDKYQKGNILPFFDMYYGPISMLYVRYYLSFKNLINSKKFKEKIMKLDSFNQKYFCFMVIYIYILNLNFEINFNNYNVSNYISIITLVKEFINEYNSIIKK